jgi:tetratricopeptide (TPR) repeat protein
MGVMRIIIWIPFLLFILFLTGCGSGLGLPGVDGLSTPDQLISKGWEEFDNQNYSLSAEYFSKALDRMPSETEKAEANTGLGWCRAKIDGIKSGMVYFEKGSKFFNDAKIGLAGAYLSNANQKDYEKAVELLEEIGLSSLDYVYKSQHDIGVTNAEAHALLGILYYYTGNLGAAQAQIRKAKQIDDNISSSVDQIAQQFITEGI